MVYQPVEIRTRDRKGARGAMERHWFSSSLFPCAPCALAVDSSGFFNRLLCRREREERGVVRDAEVGEVRVQLAGLEAAEADDVPEGAADVAAQLVAAVGGEGGPAF